MSNERIRAERGEDWPDNDDDYPVLLKGEALTWGVHSVYFSAAERADAFIDQINGAPAAPSEGDGRRPIGVYEGTDGGGQLYLAPNFAVPDGWRRCDWSSAVGSSDPRDHVTAVEPMTTPAAPLPPGVHRAPTGELLWHAVEHPMPEGYEAFRNGCWGAMGHDPRHNWWYEVRPVPPVPEPEKVGLHELRGRTLADVADSGPVVKIEQNRDGAWGAFLAWGGFPSPITLDADGLVSVLPLGDPK